MLPGLCACQEVNRFGKPTLILFPLGRTRFVLALVGRYRFGRPTPIDTTWGGGYYPIAFLRSLINVDISTGLVRMSAN